MLIFVKLIQNITADLQHTKKNHVFYLDYFVFTLANNYS